VQQIDRLLASVAGSASKISLSTSFRGTVELGKTDKGIGRLTPTAESESGGGLVWFGLFVHPFSHICNTGHVNYRLQFTTHLVVYRHLHNII
jgi:hypothetical protein